MKHKLRALANQILDLVGADDEASETSADDESSESSPSGSDKRMTSNDDEGAQVTPMDGMKNDVSTGKSGADKKDRAMKMYSAMLAGKIKQKAK